MRSILKSLNKNLKTDFSPIAIIYTSMIITLSRLYKVQAFSFSTPSTCFKHFILQG